MGWLTLRRIVEMVRARDPYLGEKGEFRTVVDPEGGIRLEGDMDDLILHLRDISPEYRERERKGEGVSDEEVAWQVRDAVEWATRNVCRELDREETTVPGIGHRSAGLYECSLQGSDRFFLVVNRILHEGFGNIYEFSVHEDRDEALRRFETSSMIYRKVIQQQRAGRRERKGGKREEEQEELIGLEDEELD